jgi:beta-1,2-mannosidase
MSVTTRRDLFKVGGAAAAATVVGAAATTGSAPPRALAASAPGLPVGYPLEPFVRDPANPILRPTNRRWESRFVFNPAAIVKDGLVHLLYRAQGPDGRSSIGLGISSDGVHFDRLNKPVMEATEPFELPGGCEDPRVVERGGTYFMTYTGYDGVSARLCLATSRDLLSWTKHGPLFPDFRTRTVDKPWSKSGAILTTPQNGLYYMYFGDVDIYYATSPDLIHWTAGPVDDPVMRPQPDTYTARLLEPGPPPLITENGYILLIHNAAAHDPDGKLIYRAGQALIDPADPTRELARLTTPFLVPETPEEVSGQVNNVVFVEGLVAYKGEWLMYYGQGDAGVGLLHADSRTPCG